MRGIGLDLSTVKTGLFRCDGDKLLGGDLIEPNEIKKAGGDDNWYYMQAAVIEDLAFYNRGEDDRHLDFVAIEGTYLGKNPHVFEELVGLRYCILTWLRDHNIPYYIGASATIDSACGIQPFLKRPARKAATAAFAKTLGFVVPEDVADALAVLWWGRAEHNRQTLIKESEA